MVRRKAPFIWRTDLHHIAVPGLTHAFQLTTAVLQNPHRSIERILRLKRHRFGPDVIAIFS